MRLLPFLILLVVSCKAPHAPPAFTVCTYLETGKIYCANNAIPDLVNGKELDIKPSDIVMPPTSFNDLLNWGIGLRKELINCESK